MNYQDDTLRTRVRLVNVALDANRVLAVDRYDILPLPFIESFDGVYHGVFYMYDFEAPWGKWVIERATNTYRLAVGTLPVPYDFTPIQLATAHVGRVTTVTVDDEDQAVFVVEFHAGVKEDPRVTMRRLNEVLGRDGLPIVWSIEVDDSEDTVGAIRNESAVVHCSSMVVSPDDLALVAAVIVSTSQQLIKAIRASLMTNARSLLSCDMPGRAPISVSSARRGYLSFSGNLSKVNAVGNLNVMLHPLALDPSLDDGVVFYVVPTGQQDVIPLFFDRLQLGVPIPMFSRWAPFLLEAGKKAALINDLVCWGPDFKTALRVRRNEALWGNLISKGLKNKDISME